MINQQKYVKELLKRFKIKDAKVIYIPIIITTKLGPKKICTVMQPKF